MRHFLSAFALLISLTLPALAAASLTADQTRRFIATLPDVNALGDKMRTEGKAAVLQAKMQPVPGQKFSPYTKAVGSLKTDFPSDYNALEVIARANGFTSAEDWASTGDNVMLAYIAVKAGPVDQKSIDMAKAMSPEMMAALPPEAQARMKQGVAVIETVNAVPPEHRAVVHPFVEQIDEQLGKNGGTQ